MNNLAGKVAFVTGASRGIGRAITLQLAQLGAQVIGTATTEKGAEAITQYLQEQGVTGRGLCLDITDSDAVTLAVNTCKEIYAAPNILVNNAAITRDNIMLRMKNDEWNDIIQTNLSAVFNLSKICLRDMIKARWGRIINISSVVAFTGNAGQANYCAAKAGVIGFGKSLAQEVASRNVTVNTIAPGFIDTDMTKSLTEEQRKNLLAMVPMQRMGQPEDIGQVVGFLASSAADYITGETIHINGGMYMA